MDETLFNQPQLEAIRYQDGPSLVVAGAGSGKTRVLTYKIAYLIEQGMAPWTILALTFTNKAAGEMKERIAQVVGVEQARRLWMGTFHSVFLRILRAELPLLPTDNPLHYDANFSIYDQADSRNLVKDIIREMELDDKTYRPGSVHARISDAKNHLVTAAEYAQSAGAYSYDVNVRMPDTRLIYTRYAARCRSANAMDFDDLLLNTFLLFKTMPDVLAKYQQRFQYILVDEYQDTNLAQHKIIMQLAALEPHRVCVVGDDAQSIYSFRGANIDNILGFQDAYPGTKVRLFKLEQNYRSTQTIVNAANSLIHKNEGQIHKNVFSEKEVGSRIPVMDAYSDVEEAQLVVRTIKRLHESDHEPLTNFAILYRTNAQSRVLEETLRRMGIAYQVFGGMSFYGHKEVKDAIAYFRMSVNPHDEESLKRIINTPTRGIGATTLGKIVEASGRLNQSLWQTLANPAPAGISLNKGTLGKLQQFRTMIQGFIEQSQQADAETAGRFIMAESGLQADIFSDNSVEGRARQENISELAAALHDFVETRREEGNTAISMADFLSEVALLSDLDTVGDDTAERVTLMTIHAAKGLEFDTVFITGLEEGLFPNQMANGSTREVEEERRLMYVAMTRAMHRLYISFARSRFRFGKMEFANPSRFIHDIDTTYLHFGKPQREGTATRTASRQSLFQPMSRPIFSTPQSRSNYPEPQSRPATPYPVRRNLRPLTAVSNKSTAARPSLAQATNAQSPTLTVGTRILHERFGEGEVIQIDGTGDGTKATVRFDNSGIRQLLLKFARFKTL